jgi:hypoxanthine phosphoribosyltransferase
VFAHPSERELARIFDFFRVPWRYEPDSFVLKAKGERVLEMFSPDFYLPELDLYLELTTLRQRLVTKKNRKLRLLKELYPDVNVRLLYRKDYQELLAKYGFGPDEVLSPEVEAFRAEAEADQVLFRQAEIAATVRRLGETIARDYAGRPPVLVGVLKGVSFFLADLIRQVDLPVEIDFMAVSALGKGGAVRIVKDLDVDIRGREVVLVEDIVDTGMTLRYILGHLERWQPAGLEVCALFDKRTRRLADVPIRYVGFELADEFVVGYGLDYHQRYRNLPFVARLRPERYRLPDPSASN